MAEGGGRGRAHLSARGCGFRRRISTEERRTRWSSASRTRRQRRRGAAATLAAASGGRSSGSGGGEWLHGVGAMESSGEAGGKRKSEEEDAGMDFIGAGRRRGGGFGGGGDGRRLGKDPTDGPYIDGGENQKVTTVYRNRWWGPDTRTLHTVRSFPSAKGQRNCYSLPTHIGSKYLVRLDFLYGNYDGMDNPSLKFNLTLGVKHWDTGTPFVSTVELRPLGILPYPAVMGNVSLSLYVRSNVGSSPDDDNLRQVVTDDYTSLLTGESPSLVIKTFDGLKNIAVTVAEAAGGRWRKVKAADAGSASPDLVEAGYGVHRSAAEEAASGSRGRGCGGGEGVGGRIRGGVGGWEAREGAGGQIRLPGGQTWRHRQPGGEERRRWPDPASRWPDLATGGQEAATAWALKAGIPSEMYPDDQYDRFWSTDEAHPLSTNISTQTTIQPSTEFAVPSPVLQKAIVPSGNSMKLVFFSGQVDVLLRNHFVILHFADFQNNKSREFTVSIDNGVHSSPYSTPYLNGLSVTGSWSSDSEGKYNFTIAATAISALPPILNAYEVYGRIVHDNPTTFSQDFDAIMAIKYEYGIKKNWMGDPCFPHEYVWDGVKCSDAGDKIMRIISLGVKMVRKLSGFWTYFKKRNLSVGVFLEFFGNGNEFENIFSETESEMIRPVSVGTRNKSETFQKFSN
uniref:Plant disease resistance polyprotein-like n=1 Tax=Oryza sativa subsp. japonica TaxID=39947 RepID=Q5SMQ4_ORYSJ|nr:plant disease resistance polyprotein-like [Oryza sativa Japonica Group]